PLVCGNLLLIGRQVRQECLDYTCVKLFSGVLAEKLASLLAGHGLAILAILANGVETVDNRENAGGQRYLLAFEPVRVAATIPPLMVMSHDRDHRIREADSLKNLRSDYRMDLHPV